MRRGPSVVFLLGMSGLLAPFAHMCLRMSHRAPLAPDWSEFQMMQCMATQMCACLFERHVVTSSWATHFVWGATRRNVMALQHHIFTDVSNFGFMCFGDKIAEFFHVFDLVNKMHAFWRVNHVIRDWTSHKYILTHVRSANFRNTNFSEMNLAFYHRQKLTPCGKPNDVASMPSKCTQHDLFE